MSRDRAGDFQVVSDSGFDGSWAREWDLNGGVKRFQVKDGVTFQVEQLQELFYLFVGVGWPDSQVITGGVLNVGARDIDFGVDTVTVAGLEQLVGLGDRGNVWLGQVEWAQLDTFVVERELVSRQVLQRGLTEEVFSVTVSKVSNLKEGTNFS